jgi:hypothetical protein
MMVLMTPDERLEQIRKARADMDRAQTRTDGARERLHAEIAEALAEATRLPDDQKRKLGPSAIGRAANFTREYITKIRDGKTK